MTVNNIFSTLENVAKIIDGREGKERTIKENFDKKVGINKEQHDEVVSLTRTYEDAEDSVRQYDKEIEQCTQSLKKLDSSIQKLEENLKKTKTPESKEKVQKEIDKKKDAKEKLQTRKENLSSSQFKEKQVLRRAKRRLNKHGVDPEMAKQSLGKMDKSLAKNASGGLANMIGKLPKMAGPIAAVGVLVKAIEFGINKATQYTQLHYENTMRAMSATTTVSLNQMKAGLDSWQDSVNGAYSAQSLAIESQLAVMEAANATALANMKLAHTWTNWIPIWGELNKAQETTLQLEQDLKKLELENANKRIQQLGEYVKRADEYIKKQDKAVHGYQIENGLSVSQTRAFEDRMLGMGETFSKYNKTIEDALKMQSQYAETSGRTVNFSNAEYEKNFAVGRVVGEDNLMNFEAQMNIFNQSVSDSADIMYEMYKDANRMGISQKKLVKDVLGNLKLANKYDFKNGTKGFIELSKWAESARFNLGSLGGALEKIQSGGLEGVIKQSAGLQVLGGSFAMGSNPLSMMFEANADPEAYAKHIQKMFSTMGRFDRKTGETKFNMQENMIMRAAAEQLGISVEDAKNMARGARQKDVVKQQMGGSTLGKEDQDAIANKAQFDKKTGQWYVNTISGGRMNVGDVKTQDLDNILSGNKEEDATKYAQSTLSAVETIEATTKAIDAKLGAATFGDFMTTTKAANQQTLDAFSKNLDTIANGITEYRQNSLDKQADMLKELSTIDVDIKGAFKTVDEYESDNKKRYEEMKEWLHTMKENTKAAESKTANRWGDVEKAYSEGQNTGYFENFAKGQNISTARARHYSAKGDEDYAKGNYGGYIINKASAFGNQTIGRAAQAIGNFFGFDASTVDDFVHDGVASGNGSPMVVSASNVTSIQDGSVKLAKSDPRDSAIFAKTGGPFDKLFDDIFGKVNAIYDMSVKNSTTSNVFGPSSTTNNRYGGNMVQSMLENHFANVFGSSSTTNNRYDTLGALYDTWRDPKVHEKRMQEFGQGIGRINPKTGEREYNFTENMQTARVARIQGRNIDDIKSDFTRGNYVAPAPDRKQREYAMPSTESINELARIASQGNGSSIQQSQGINQPLDVHIYGDLNLKSPTGETINLTQMIQNDPMLIRRVTELIVSQIGKNIHGGKTEVNRNRFAYT